MGRKQIPGIYWDEKRNRWNVDKVINSSRVRHSFGSDYAEAEAWLIKQSEDRRQQRLFGTRARRTFAQLAAHYLVENQHKLSIMTEIILLKSLMPYVGEIPIDEICDESFKQYISDRREAGRKNKTINLALAVARHMLNLAARKYRDGKVTWLATAPMIELLPLNDQRQPYQLSWLQQRALLPQLPPHLARMALFMLNTGARDDVVCSLKWDWEVPMDNAGITFFVVPKEHVKGRRRDRILVLNKVAKSVIDEVRGQHPEYVFVYRRIDKDGNISRCHPVETMNNTAWQSARVRAGLRGLHVHDLRHTVGMRLREGSVDSETRADLLWHNRQGMSAHYAQAQIIELHNAIELISDERNCSNRSVESIIKEVRERRGNNKQSPQSPHATKTG
jgi:integrase